MKEKGLPSRILAGAGSAVVIGAGGAASGLGHAILRNPKATLYATTFIVAFSFVAANALWYQPGHHPSAFLATRDPSHPNAIAGYRPFQKADPADVTTFRIERAPSGAQTIRSTQATGQEQPAQAPTQTAAVNQPYTGQQPPITAKPPTDDIRAIIAGQAPADQAQTTGGASLVADIQRALAGRGLYDGTADGLMGPRTQAAIVSFEQKSGLPQRGHPTPELLAALQSQASGQSTSTRAQSQDLLNDNPFPTPVPRQAPRGEQAKGEQARGEQAQSQPARAITVASRPTPSAIKPSAAQPMVQPMVQKVSASARNEDPITAAIRSADRQPSMTPPAAIPGAARMAATPATAHRSDAGLPNTMVLQIQKGLSNIAYTDVELDGVAGPQTKAAIRRFQKHYRLPETGEPDQLVLAKLKAIGAL